MCVCVWAAGAQPLLHPRDTPPQPKTAQHQGLQLHVRSGGDTRWGSGAEGTQAGVDMVGGVRRQAPSKLSVRTCSEVTHAALTGPSRTPIPPDEHTDTHQHPRIHGHTNPHSHAAHRLPRTRVKHSPRAQGHSNFLSPQSANVRSCPLGLNFFRGGTRDLTKKGGSDWGSWVGRAALGAPGFRALSPAPLTW